MWVTTPNPIILEIKSKFNYGDHGERELIKLFERIGIDDIFLEVKVFQTQESILDDIEHQEIDIKGSFNSVTNLRNNIIHQDASPNIGIDSVEQYKEHLKLFAKNLIDFLEITITQFNC